MLLLQVVSFPVTNNLGTPYSERQINFGMLQIDTENSAAGLKIIEAMNENNLKMNEE